MADGTPLALSWREVSGHASGSVLLTLKRAAGVTLIVIACLCLIVRATQPDDAAFLPADLALITAFLVIAGRMVRGHLRALEIGALMVAGAAASVWAPASTLAQFAVPAATTNVLLALVVTLEPVPALAMGTVITVVTVLVRWRWAQVPLDFAMHMAVLQTGMLVAAVVVVAAVFRSIRSSDALAAEVRSAAERSQVRDEEYQSREMIRRILHDDVLTALRGLAEPVSGPNHVTAATLRTACRAAVQAILELTSTGPPAGEHHIGFRDRTRKSGAAHAASRIIDGLPLTVSLDIREGLAPSTHVEEALVQSAREALRNVSRHAGTHEAELVVDYSGTSAVVTVHDHGLGFLAGDVPAGVGITSSIVSRMDEVGGSARLTSRPGQGSSWLLEGPPHVATAERHVDPVIDHGLEPTDFLAVEQRRLAWGVTLPLLAANIWLAVFFVPRNALVGAEVAVAAAMTCTTVLAAALVAGGTPSRAVVTFFAVIQPALLLVHMWGAGSAATGDFRSWGAAFGAVPLVLVAFFVSSRGALLAILLPYAAALVLVVALDSTTAFSSSFGFITAFVGILISWVLGVGLRRSWQQVESQRHQVHLARVDERRRANLESLKGQYLGHVVSAVLPFLDEIATGRRDVCDHHLSGVAHLLTMSTRDDLYAPGFFSPELRRDVDEYRSSGGTIDIRSGVPPHAGRGAEAVLRALVRDRCGQRRIIVTHHSIAQAEAGPGTRVVVLPPLSEDELALFARPSHRRAAVVEHGDFNTVLHIPELPASGDGRSDQRGLESGDER